MLRAQTAEREAAATAPVPGAAPVNDQRILGVIPDFQTVRDTSQPVAPMSVKEKWHLVWKQAVDPFNLATSAFSSGFSQADNETPKYGRGGAAYSERFAAAVADLGTQTMFSEGVLASLLHQDPRYFRKGPSSGIGGRIVYSISRIVITRKDAGTETFNSSNLFGMMLGIAASNAYYPPGSRTSGVMLGRIGTSLFGGLTGNLLSEFWPDLQNRFLRKKHKRD